MGDERVDRVPRASDRSARGGAIVAIAAVGLGLAGVLTSGHARADGAGDAAVAEKLFLEGRAAMLRGDFATGCPKLAESQRIDPGVGTLLNLGECYEKDGKTASAWAIYREAEPMARRLGQKDRALHAAARAEALSAALSYVTLRVASHPRGLSVSIDDKPVSEAAWSTPIPVDPGRHAISATAPGRKTWRSSIEIGKAAKRAVEVPDLEKAPDDKGGGGAVGAVGADGPEDPGALQRTLGWSGVVVGGLALGAGAVFGLVAKSTHDDAESNHCTAVDCDARGLELIDSAKGSALASTVFFAVGGAALATGVVLLVTAPGGRRVALAPYGAGAGLRGTW